MGVCTALLCKCINAFSTKLLRVVDWLRVGMYIADLFVRGAEVAFDRN